MNTEIPTAIPMAIVPALIGRDKAAVSRTAARDRWPTFSPPGYVSRSAIAVADLERRVGMTFTAADIDRAIRQHADRLRSAAISRADRRQPTPFSSVVEDVFSRSPTHVRPTC
jgi:hypothetical protein